MYGIWPTKQSSNCVQKLYTASFQNAYILSLTQTTRGTTISLALNKKSAQKQKKQTDKQRLLASRCFIKNQQTNRKITYRSNPNLKKSWVVFFYRHLTMTTIFLGDRQGPIRSTWHDRNHEMQPCLVARYFQSRINHGGSRRSRQLNFTAKSQTRSSRLKSSGVIVTELLSMNIGRNVGTVKYPPSTLMYLGPELTLPVWLRRKYIPHRAIGVKCLTSVVFSGTMEPRKP
jgi:hypothetical protein